MLYMPHYFLILTMKHVIIGDIHGRYDLLLSLMVKLEEGIGLTLGRDIFIFLGDYCDRGKHNKEVVVYLSELKKRYGDKIVLLMGNHDQLARDYIISKDPEERVEVILTWMYNGGYETLKSFGEKGMVDILLPFLNNTELYYETPDFICVHGGIPILRTINTASETELLWNRENNHYRGKTQIVGHSIVRKVTQYLDTVYVDTGAFMLGQLSAIIHPSWEHITIQGDRGIGTVIPDIESILLNDVSIKETMKNNSAFTSWVHQMKELYLKGEY